MRVLILLSLAVIGYVEATNNKKFPDSFSFGVASSAYQIEGAGADFRAKRDNVWEHLLHERPDFVKNNDTADTACNSYYRTPDDMAILKDLGVTHYKLSLSWTRLQPLLNKVPNKAAVYYYQNLLEHLQAYDIEPVVTLSHWDIPQRLQELGGFMNAEIADYFEDYARMCFENFGYAVRVWLTFHEPKQQCYLGYGKNTYAPATGKLGFSEYICAHNLLLAHAKAYHVYDKEFRAKQKGKISIAVDSEWNEPKTNSTNDVAAAELKQLFTFGWFYHPIVYGDYPEVMKKTMKIRSSFQTYGRSRLPAFTDSEKALINGTYDFIAVNFYTSQIVNYLPIPEFAYTDWDWDAGVRRHQPKEWESSSTKLIKITPWGIRKLLTWIAKTYGNPHILVSGNGVDDNNGTLDDDFRSKFITDHLSNVRDAMEFDGVQVSGYTVSDLMDSFEWDYGYTRKFGLYQVDNTDGQSPRIPKKSAKFYKNLIETRCLVPKCES